MKKSKHFLALLLIIIGLGFFSCGFCASEKKRVKLTKTEKIAKKINENRIKLKNQIENIDKLMLEADSVILVNNAEIQTSNLMIDVRTQNLKHMEIAVKKLESNELDESEKNLLSEILIPELSPENAQKCAVYLKNPAQNSTSEEKTMIDDAAVLYKLESETEINTLNAYVTKLQEQIIVKREERKKLAMQKDELQQQLALAEEQCEEFERRAAMEKAEKAKIVKTDTNNNEEPPKITMTVIVPPNAFKFVKFEPDTDMFDTMLRNIRLFVPVNTPAEQNSTKIVEVALDDDYTFMLLEEKPPVWLEEVKVPTAGQEKPQKASSKSAQLPRENPSTAVKYCFEQFCPVNLPQKISNPAMTDDISELKRYKVLNINTYFTFTPEEIICPQETTNKR